MTNPSHAIRPRRIVGCSQTDTLVKQDELCAEQHLLFYVNGSYIGRTIHTPGDELDMTFGYIFVEGVISSAQDVDNVISSPVQSSMYRADITLTHARSKHWEEMQQHFSPQAYAEPVAKKPEPTPWTVTPGQLVEYMRAMEFAQIIFPRTGGAHCAALFTAEGKKLAQAEDIGRHNALDKVIGACLRNNTLNKAKLGTLSSRLSWELVRKANAAGLKLLAGISAASSLAVETAEQCGITLVGRLRKGTMNVYCHNHRVALPGSLQNNSLPYQNEQFYCSIASTPPAHGKN